MEITVFREPVDDLLLVKVSLFESIDDKGYTVTAEVWVPYDDSRAALEKAARHAAIATLKLALSALADENHQ